MLILTRRISETILIGDDIEMTVLGVKGNQVRLGFKAPESVTSLREEVKRRNEQEAEASFQRGEQLAKAGDLAAAAVQIEKAVELAPRTPRYLASLGWLLSRFRKRSWLAPIRRRNVPRRNHSSAWPL